MLRVMNNKELRGHNSYIQTVRRLPEDGFEKHKKWSVLVDPSHGTAILITFDNNLILIMSNIIV